MDVNEKVDQNFFAKIDQINEKEFTHFISQTALARCDFLP